MQQPKTSRDIPAPGPTKDTERDTRQAVIQDADKTDGKDREQEHGDGSHIGLDKK